MKTISAISRLLKRIDNANQPAPRWAWFLFAGVVLILFAVLLLGPSSGISEQNQQTLILTGALGSK